MEKPPVRVGVGVFIFKDGKFIMGKRQNSHGAGQWTLPGGHVEFGESLEDAVRREALEEFGLRIKDVRFGAVTSDVFTDEGKHYISIWMTSAYDHGKEENLEPHKCTEIGWFDFDHLPSPLFLPWNQLLKSEFIEDINKLSKQ